MKSDSMETAKTTVEDARTHLQARRESLRGLYASFRDYACKPFGASAAKISLRTDHTVAFIKSAFVSHRVSAA
jgi:hypothetical protein